MSVTKISLITMMVGLCSVAAYGFGMSPSSRSLILSYRAQSIGGLAQSSLIGSRRSMAMQSNSKEAEDDFELTVDWDEELRKLNAGELHVKPRYFREKQKRQEQEAMNDWMKSNSRKAKAVAKETNFKVRTAMRKSNPLWQRLSRDWRFWVGLLAGVSLLASLMSATSRSSDLVVLNDADELARCIVDNGAYTALLAQAASHVTGEAMSQLTATGVASLMV